jgi:hypothetical protein
MATDDKTRHLRALADFLGKEFYALDYDAPTGFFRLLPPPATGLEPLALYRVYTAEEDQQRDPRELAEHAYEHATWPYYGIEYHIYALRTKGTGVIL